MISSKIALVTGGSRGLGRDAALSLAKKGISVVITYHTKKEEALHVVSDIEKMKQKVVAVETDFNGAAIRNNP